MTYVFYTGLARWDPWLGWQRQCQLKQGANSKVRLLFDHKDFIKNPIRPPPPRDLSDPRSCPPSMYCPNTGWSKGTLCGTWGTPESGQWYLERERWFVGRSSGPDCNRCFSLNLAWHFVLFIFLTRNTNQGWRRGESEIWSPDMLPSDCWTSELVAPPTPPPPAAIWLTLGRDPPYLDDNNECYLSGKTWHVMRVSGKYPKNDQSSEGQPM